VPAGATTCPSCGAALQSDAEDDASIPGVTEIDPVTAARKPIARPNRLVSWLAGDVDPLPPPNPIPVDRLSQAVPSGAALEGVGQASYAPPSEAVRREMARLELDAIKAELEAQSGETLPDPAVTVRDGEAESSAATAASDSAAAASDNAAPATDEAPTTGEAPARGEPPPKPEGETAG
jgi:hypothetical protein